MSILCVAKIRSLSLTWLLGLHSPRSVHFLTSPDFAPFVPDRKVVHQVPPVLFHLDTRSGEKGGWVVWRCHNGIVGKPLLEIL